MVLYWIGAAILTAALAFLLMLTYRPLRRRLISRRIMALIAKMLPQMGETERVALEAGTTWWDRELFSGNPNWSQFLNLPEKHLSAEERAFLDGPVSEVCRMVDDWDTYQTGDLSPEIWDF